MRFALTTQDFESITPHAGRARKFLVFEAEAGTEPVKIKHLEIGEDQIFHIFDGNGPHPLDEVQVVITGNAREKFIRKCSDRGIQAVLTSESDPMTAIKGFFAGTLPPSVPLPEKCDHEH